MKLSLITVCLNSASTISDTLSSVLNQTFKDFEYIVIDALSTDNTLNILKEFEPKFEGRLKVFSERDSGIYYAMNKGLCRSQGEYIGIINSDDFYIDPNALRCVLDAFEAGKVDAVYTNLFVVDPADTNHILRKCTYCDFKKGMFFKGWHPGHPTFFLSKKKYLEFGMFDLDFKISADFELMLRMFEKKSISSMHLDKFILKMRHGGASSSSFKPRIRGQLECLLAFKKNDLKINMFIYFIFKYFQKIKQFKF